MSVYSDIQAALNSRLDTLSGDYPVAWENARHQPEGADTFLRASLKMFQPKQAALGPDAPDLHTGRFRVDCLAEAGAGWGEVFAAADRVALVFARGTRLAHGSVSLTCESAWPGPGSREKGGRYKVTVSIPFFAYV